MATARRHRIGERSIARALRLLGLVAALAGAAPASAAVQIAMSIDGPRGPFASRGTGSVNALHILNVAVDFAPDAGATAPRADGTSGLRPVQVTRPVDASSGQFLDALASREQLHVVISMVQVSAEDGLPIRRVITLSGARVSAVHDVLDAKNPDSLGVETITFTYDGIDIEDGGVKVFSSGG